MFKTLTTNKVTTTERSKHLTDEAAINQLLNGFSGRLKRKSPSRSKKPSQGGSERSQGKVAMFPPLYETALSYKEVKYHLEQQKIKLDHRNSELDQ